jgi:superkiller protein 3
MVRRKNPGDTWTNILVSNRYYSLALAAILVIYSLVFINRNTDWQNNLTLYTSDVSRSPYSARAHYNYGSELFLQARQEQNTEQKMKLQDLSFAELKRAISIYPNYLDALNNMGNVWESKNNLDSSNNCYLKILKIDSTYIKCYFNLGLNYYKMQQPGKSNHFLEKLVKLQPDNAKALYLLGNNYGTLGNYDLAVKSLERCVAIDDKTADALPLLGKAYWFSKNYDKASQVFKKALLQDPDNFDFNMNIAYAYRMLNRCNESLVFLEKCEKLQPANPVVYSELMQCYAKLGDEQKAKENRAKYNELSSKPIK